MSQAPRIYVAVCSDEFGVLYDAGTRARLAAIGDVDFADGTGAMPVPDDLADSYDVLITSWSTQKCDPERLHGSRLRLAVHSTGTIRGLFPKSVLETGLRLTQGGSDAMALPVAEMALTMTLVLLRNVQLHDRRLQETRDWGPGGTGMLGNSIQAQHIGIVGLSRTGRHYATMVRGLGVEDVVAYDPYATYADAAAFGVELVDLDALCRTSDVVAVHAPSSAETHHMLDAARLALLRDDAILINTARSSVVDQDALLAELTAGRLRAGLDVFDEEPPPDSSPFYGLENVLITPHVAGGTVEARFRQGATVVDEIERFLGGEPLQHEVTVDIYDRLS